MCTGGMDSVTQALKSYCEAEYMEDANMYECGSAKCKGKKQNAHKSLHFQVGLYNSKIGENRYVRFAVPFRWADSLRRFATPFLCLVLVLRSASPSHCTISV